MKLKLFLILLIGGCFFVSASSLAAGISDYEKVYDIDLEQDQLPTLEELKSFFYKQQVLYNPQYKSVFDLQGDFNPEFRQTIITYGMNEKRLKWPDEDAFLEVLASLPKEMYEYIGPALFSVPNMSEKILNMPGIKETKNRFPSRVADALKDIEDLEFLSPGLYYLLRPEVWEEPKENFEFPVKRKAFAKVVYDGEFYQNLRKLVPPEKYMENGNLAKTLTKSDLRTLNPTKNSLLTAKDVEAFINTLDGVEEWAKQNGNQMKVYQLTTMWLAYDAAAENFVAAPGMKDLVNPCQRLVQKASILGEELSLAKVVAKEGFTLNEWAYTCDKTLKAYRLSQIPRYMVLAIKRYKSGSDDDEIKKLSPKMQQVRYSTMQAIIEMYKAPLADVMEVRKHRKTLHDKFFKNDFKLVGTPISGVD